MRNNKLWYWVLIVVEIISVFSVLYLIYRSVLRWYKPASRQRCEDRGGVFQDSFIDSDGWYNDYKCVESDEKGRCRQALRGNGILRALIPDVPPTE